MIDELLLVLSRALLLTTSPANAHAVLRHLGAILPRRDTPDSVRTATRRLRRRGSCLSRSLAIAARAPSSQVVIGVNLRATAALEAHAWLEIDGKPVDPDDPQGREIARLIAPGRWTT